MKAALPLLLATSVAGAPAPLLLTATTVDVPAISVEIVAHSAPAGLVLGTNSADNSLSVSAVESWNPVRLVPRDADDRKPGVQGIPLPATPTSVAAHPTLPVAFACLPNDKSSQRGSVVAIDLAPGRLGKVLQTWEVGYHPDSIAISPDGRWLATACEGAGKNRTPGSVHLIRLDSPPSADRPTFATTSFDLADLGRRFGVPDDDVEPEYVSFAPDSRFLVASCQENDGVLLIDLAGPAPVIAQVVRTLPGAWPDGVAVRDGVIATADEGDESKTKGQSVSFFTFNPADPATPALRVATVDMRPIATPNKPERNCDPENIKLVRLAGRLVALVVMEDRNGVAVLDATAPGQPVPAGILNTGTRPEGIAVVEEPDRVRVITGDEGKKNFGGPGEITIGEIRPAG